MAQCSKEIGIVVEYAVKNGFVVERTKKHFILSFRKDDGKVHKLSISKTPSCAHAHKNALGDVKRILRQSGVAV